MIDWSDMNEYERALIRSQRYQARVKRRKEKERQDDLERQEEQKEKNEQR